MGHPSSHLTLTPVDTFAVLFLPPLSHLIQPSSRWDWNNYGNSLFLHFYHPLINVSENIQEWVRFVPAVIEISDFTLYV